MTADGKTVFVCDTNNHAIRVLPHSLLPPFSRVSTPVLCGAQVIDVDTAAVRTLDLTGFAAAATTSAPAASTTSTPQAQVRMQRVGTGLWGGGH